jgi:hypothetical protein
MPGIDPLLSIYYEQGGNPMPLDTPEPEEEKRRAAESILGDVDLRDELTDDEAQPLIDFGLSQVEALARRAAGLSSPQTLDESVGNLRRLMKRINRFVAERRQGDPELTRKSLERIARISAELYGEAAPQPSPEALENFLKVESDLNNQIVVQQLLKMFAPPSPPAQELDAPPQREQLAGPPKPDQIEPPAFLEKLGAPPKKPQIDAPPEPGLLERLFKPKPEAPDESPAPDAPTPPGDDEPA